MCRILLENVDTKRSLKWERIIHHQMDQEKFMQKMHTTKKYRLADAFIAKSLSVGLIVNFYITTYKPTKAFRDLEKAKV